MQKITRITGRLFLVLSIGVGLSGCHSGSQAESAKGSAIPATAMLIDVKNPNTNSKFPTGGVAYQDPSGAIWGPGYYGFSGAMTLALADSVCAQMGAKVPTSAQAEVLRAAIGSGSAYDATKWFPATLVTADGNNEDISFWVHDPRQAALDDIEVYSYDVMTGGICSQFAETCAPNSSYPARSLNCYGVQKPSANDYFGPRAGCANRIACVW